MGEEAIVFEKAYLELKDCDESLETRLKECMQGKYSLVLDFTRAKSGMNSDFYMAIISACSDELEKQKKEGDEWEAAFRKLVLLFESDESAAYERLMLIGLHEICSCRFRERKYAFETDYVDREGIKLIEDRLRECLQGKYKLTIDFSKAKTGIHDCFIGDLIRVCNEAGGEDFIDTAKEKLTLLFESKESAAYQKIDRLGLTPLFAIKFKNEA